MGVEKATEIKFDLTTLKAGDFPRIRGKSNTATFAVLPLIVTQCPYGPAGDPETWANLPLRTLAGVMRQLQDAAAAVRSDLKGWTFDMEALTPADLDAIDSAIYGETAAGARMIAKYAVGVPASVFALLGPQDAQAPRAGLTADDVLQLPYYTLYAPLIQRLLKEAREEYSAGFLHALNASAG